MRRYKASILYSLYALVYYGCALVVAGDNHPVVAWAFVGIGALMSLLAWGIYGLELEES